MVLNSLFNKIFGFLVNWNPLWALIIISLILTFVVTIIYKLFTNQKEMKSLKEELTTIQKELKGSKEDPKQAIEIQKRLMEKNMKYMMKSFKPMLITFIPLIIILGWLKTTYQTIQLPLGWIWIYLISSVIFNIILRKLLKIY